MASSAFPCPRSSFSLPQNFTGADCKLTLALCHQRLKDSQDWNAGVLCHKAASHALSHQQPAGAGRQHPQVWASAESTGQKGLPVSQGRNLASYLVVEAMNEIRSNWNRSAPCSPPACSEQARSPAAWGAGCGFGKAARDAVIAEKLGLQHRISVWGFPALEKGRSLPFPAARILLNRALRICTQTIAVSLGSEQSPAQNLRGSEKRGSAIAFNFNYKCRLALLSPTHTPFHAWFLLWFLWGKRGNSSVCNLG